MTPLVSIITPTYNRPDMLVRAVKSVLAQTYQNLEIIVVNDAGSPVEQALAELNDTRISYIRLGKNVERSAVRNLGILAAQGTYIAYLDDDDIYYPDHIETLVTALQKYSQEAAYTNAYRAVQDKKEGVYVTVDRQLHYAQDYSIEKMAIDNLFPNLCVMHTKKCLEKVGYFDEGLTVLEDWDLWIRIGAEFGFLHISKVTAEYSFRSDSTNTTTKRAMQFVAIREHIFKKYRYLIADKPELIAIQEASIRDHRAFLTTGTMPIEQFIGYVVGMIEQGNNAAALDLYDQYRTAYGAAKELEKFDALVANVKKQVSKK